MVYHDCIPGHVKLLLYHSLNDTEKVYFHYSRNSGTRKARGKEEAQGNCPQTAFLFPANLFDIFLLTSFANNVTTDCHKWGYKQTNFLLAPLAALFCSPILKNGGPARYCIVQCANR